MQLSAVVHCGWYCDLQLVSIEAPSVVVPGMRGGADVERLEFPAVWHCLRPGVPSAFLECTPDVTCLGDESA